MQSYGFFLAKWRKKKEMLRKKLRSRKVEEEEDVASQKTVQGN